MMVLVCGGRSFGNYGWLNHELDLFHARRGPITLIIEGGAPGADRLAREWAKSRRIPFVTENAEWDKYGKAAGPIRNGVMLAKHKPDIVLAFSGGTGTHDMLAKAKDAKIEAIYFTSVTPRLAIVQ